MLQQFGLFLDFSEHFRPPTSLIATLLVVIWPILEEREKNNLVFESLKSYFESKFSYFKNLSILTCFLDNKSFLPTPVQKSFGTFCKIKVFQNIWKILEKRGIPRYANERWVLKMQRIKQHSRNFYLFLLFKHLLCFFNKFNNFQKIHNYY